MEIKEIENKLNSYKNKTVDVIKLRQRIEELRNKQGTHAYNATEIHSNVKRVSNDEEISDSILTLEDELLHTEYEQIKAKDEIMDLITLLDSDLYMILYFKFIDFTDFEGIAKLLPRHIENHMYKTAMEQLKYKLS